MNHFFQKYPVGFQRWKKAGLMWDKESAGMITIRHENLTRKWEMSPKMIHHPEFVLPLLLPSRWPLSSYSSVLISGSSVLTKPTLFFIKLLFMISEVTTKTCGNSKLSYIKWQKQRFSSKHSSIILRKNYVMILQFLSF